jgi:8-oxo-(d)GTP phosphatase
MSILLLRHAWAGDSEKWEGDDRVRPVDKRGRKQSEGLVDVLAGFAIDRIVSSPYVRCIQTVEPLADARGLEIELDERLGADQLEDVPDVLEELERQNAVVCTHGELPWLDGRKFKKGSTWVLDGELQPRRYIKAPG